MKRSTIPNRRERALVFVLGTGFLLALTTTPGGMAAPPLAPLPPPFFSFDLQSDFSGTTLRAADILVLSGGQPSLALAGETLELHSPQDDLDAFSANIVLMPGQPFVLLFSLDRASTGQAEPDPLLVDLGVPFNAADQAARGQAAGDEFMGMQLFTPAGAIPARGARAMNCVLVRNNYDEGGTDFGAMPATDAYGNVVVKTFQDNVDAVGALAHAPDGSIINVYFSLTASSPSLSTLPGGLQRSGATIFYNPDPQHLTPTMIYATWYELGLVQNDDIDALLVFDTNANGHFDGLDQVLFSLSPGSPSLATIQGASTQGAAADVFIGTPGQLPAPFAPASFFGLGAPSDNIDALDLVPCSEALDCATQFGIRALKGDLNCDNTVGFRDINPFVLALSNPVAYKNAFPDCFIANGDINVDGAVNFRDINPFVAILSGGH